MHHHCSRSPAGDEEVVGACSCVRVVVSRRHRDAIHDELLAALTRIGDVWLLASSRARPSMELMRSIARAFDIDPALFPEYRLALARAELDEQVVGLAAAVENLDRVEWAADLDT